MRVGEDADSIAAHETFLRKGRRKPAGACRELCVAQRDVADAHRVADAQREGIIGEVEARKEKAHRFRPRVSAALFAKKSCARARISLCSLADEKRALSQRK